MVTASSRTFARVFVKRFALRVRAGKFFDERDAPAFRHFHVYSRQFHMGHTLRS